MVNLTYLHPSATKHMEERLKKKIRRKGKRRGKGWQGQRCREKTAIYVQGQRSQRHKPGGILILGFQPLKMGGNKYGFCYLSHTACGPIFSSLRQIIHCVISRNLSFPGCEVGLTTPAVLGLGEKESEL